MKIIEYNNCDNIIVEFQDKYNAKVHTQYKSFLNGEVKNPYHNSVFNVGMIGEKYPISIDRKLTKEYNTWSGMLRRCFNEKHKNEHPTYDNASCCDDWLLYDNFYEWLHNQENFDKWSGDNKFAIDKDILIKGNKHYGPNTCCLVPMSVNSLFAFEKPKVYDDELPIGVKKKKNKFYSRCCNPITGERKYLGSYSTSEEAFFVYKQYKENLIRQVAELEYSNGNITKQCYDAMMNYKL